MGQMRKQAMIRRLGVALLGLTMTSGFAVSAEDAVKVIANKQAADSELTVDDIRDAFLGRKKKWPKCGENLVVVTLKGTDAHTQFLQKYLEKDASQFDRYWKAQVFSGKGIFPKSFETEKELVDFIAATPGAIGYVSANPGSDKVQEVKVK